MEKFKIAKRDFTATGGNKRRVDSLFLTLQSSSPEVTRTYELLWERAKLLTPSVVFDPLNIFENKGVDVSDHGSTENDMNNTEDDMNDTENMNAIEKYVTTEG